MRTVIRGAEIYQGRRFRKADVVVDGERIHQVAPPGEGKGAEILNAAGCQLFPGLIDVHVHFRDPGLEAKEGWRNGSMAAVRGGVTTVFEIQNNPPFCTSLAVLAQRHAKAAGGLVDFGCYGSLLPETIPNVKSMAPEIPGWKLFLGGSTGMGGWEDREQLRKLFAAAAESGLPIVAHCEDEAILRANREKARDADAASHHLLRPASAEVASVETAVSLCEETGAVLHVFHVSAGGSVDRIADARDRGLPVSASVSPHHLLFTSEDTARAGNFLKVNPPIQTREDREHLREAVRKNVIEVIATDHAPHFRKEKELDYADAPSGLPSVELLFPLVYTMASEGVFPLDRALDAMTEAPAKLFGIDGKGRIEEGFDADLVCVDSSSARAVGESDVVSRAGWTPYGGRRLQGFPVWTMVRGKVVFDKDGFAEGGWGRRIRLAKQGRK